MPTITNKKTGLKQNVTHDEVARIKANRMTAGLFNYENMEPVPEPDEVTALKEEKPKRINVRSGGASAGKTARAKSSVAKSTRKKSDSSTSTSLFNGAQFIWPGGDTTMAETIWI